MIVRDFNPAIQPFATLAANGAIVFRDDKTNDRIALRAALDNGEPVAMVDYIAWESPLLSVLLHWGYQWAGANGLSHLVCPIGTVEQRAALNAAAWEGALRYAVLSLFPKPMEEAPIEQEAPRQKPRKEKKRAPHHSASQSPEPAISTQSAPANPPRTYSAPLVSNFQPNRVGPPPARGFDTD